jgi:hypothetical protein
MNNDSTPKLKYWTTPEIHTLDISRDTEQLNPPSVDDQQLS